MQRKKVLIFFISDNSGHHCAAQAIERALRAKDDRIEILCINSFNYTNPILEKIINNTYMGIIRTSPEVWEYLYDNPQILQRTHKLRSFIHKYNSGKLKKLLDEFNPDAIVCTQAFPCGMVADYKKTFSVDTPLIGVITDYIAHSYWLYERVDAYVVPSNAAKEKLQSNNIPENKIFIFGIPIDHKFLTPTDKTKICRIVGLEKETPKVLLMGGGQGLGAIKEVVLFLDKISLPVNIIVVCGTNRPLKNWLERKTTKFNKTVIPFGYTDIVKELMGIADLIITKPGGLTTAEALSSGLPMIILNPLPGQEAKNTEFLLNEAAAKKAGTPHEVADLVVELFNHPSELNNMHTQALKHAHPDSAIRTADLVFNLISA
ncbi:MAG: glycosyltransferase [Candidatus Omnitrophota bacterium]